MNWTEKQQKVIDSRNKNLLISAAAGSGKTAGRHDSERCALRLPGAVVLRGGPRSPR